MDHLTYRQYLEDPEMRSRIEREARRARTDAMWELVMEPIARIVAGLLPPPAAKPADASTWRDSGLRTLEES